MKETRDFFAAPIKDPEKGDTVLLDLRMYYESHRKENARVVYLTHAGKIKRFNKDYYIVSDKGKAYARGGEVCRIAYTGDYVKLTTLSEKEPIVLSLEEYEAMCLPVRENGARDNRRWFCSTLEFSEDEFWDIEKDRIAYLPENKHAQNKILRRNTATFTNGLCMEIRLYQSGWCQAFLYDGLKKVAQTELQGFYFDKWEIEYNGDMYEVFVKQQELELEEEQEER